MGHYNIRFIHADVITVADVRIAGAILAVEIKLFI